MLSRFSQLRRLIRTQSIYQPKLLLDGGKGSLAFSRTSPYFMRGTIPPRLKSELPSPGSSIFPPQKSSSIPPPPHWHSNQDETFVIVAGRGVFTISGCQKILSQGDEVLIPRGQYHLFANASTEEDLVVDVKLTPDNRLRDERFFRNGYGYLNDCKRVGIEPSPLQVLLFLWSADIIPALPGPEIVMRPLSRFIGWFGGVVLGKGVLGYKEWYEEYTPEDLRN